MTPERKAWWNSLPAEEKRIREIYRYAKQEILSFTDSDKKRVIKALRKQMAMRPVNAVSGICGDCPTCRGFVIRRENDCCPECGQKIRW